MLPFGADRFENDGRCIVPNLIVQSGATRWSSLGVAPSPHAVRAPIVVRVARLVGAVYIGVVVPAQRAGLNEYGSARVAVGVLLAAFATMWLVPRSWWAARIVVALAAGGALAGAEGEVTAVWIPMSLVLAVWVGGDRPPLPLRRAPAEGMTPVVMGLSYLALLLGRMVGTSWQPLLVLAATGVLVLWSVGRTRSPVRWLGESDAPTARVTRVALGAVALPPVAAARLVQHATLRRSRVDTAGWERVSPRPARPRRRGAPARDVALRPWVTAAAITAVVGLAGNAAADAWLPPIVDTRVSSSAQLGIARPGDLVPAAYRGEDWYPDFVEDLAWVMDDKVAWDPMAVQRVRDVVTRTVNVRSRVRRSWTAPECDCRRVTVWLYGGSGAFGLGQRDDHTIASELARLAAKDGVVVDVENRGMPGNPHWRNATRLSWDLTVNPPPDLIVFYDGAEEVESALALDRQGFGDIIAPYEAFLAELYRISALVPDTPLEPPPGVTFDGWPRRDTVTRSAGVLATTRYERSLSMSRATAAARDIPVRHYWQPSRFDVEAPTDLTPDQSIRQAAFVAAADSVPTGVVDLGGALDDVPGPLFSDDSTHNEVAARAIAAAMWEDLRDDVGSLAGERGRS